MTWLAEAELERLRTQRRWDPADPLRIKAVVLLDVRAHSGHLVLRVVDSRLGPLLVGCWYGPRHRHVRAGTGVLADLPLLDSDDRAAHTPLELTCVNGRCGRFILDPGKVRAAIPRRCPRRTVSIINVLG